MHSTSKILIVDSENRIGEALLRVLNEQGYQNLLIPDKEALDFSNGAEAFAYFSAHKPDYVFYFVGVQGGSTNYPEKPADWLRNGLLVQNNIIHNAYLHGVKRLLFLTDSGVDQKSCSQPMGDGASMAIAVGIEMCRAYNQQYGTEFIPAAIPDGDCSGSSLIDMMCAFHETKRLEKTYTGFENSSPAVNEQAGKLNIPLMSNNIIRKDVHCLIEFLQTHDIFTQNKYVREFERQWSEWLGVKYSVFVNSGSSANFITMAIIKELYGEGEIIVPAITWASDFASVIAAGHRPVVVDVNLHNLSMAEDKMLAAITPQTKAVFLTHVLGFNGLSQRMLAELSQRKIILVEDVCESHGATFHEQKLGSFGLIANFSFYYAHHMSTIEGGVLCTNDERIYQYARMFRSHGMVRESDSEELKEKYRQEYPGVHPEFTFCVPGYNMRSTELNAVIGLSQLGRLDVNNEIRTRNFKLFLAHLDTVKYYTEFDLVGSVNYALILIVRKADPVFFAKVCQALRDANVEFRRGTAGGGNEARQPFIQRACPGLDAASFVNAEHIHSYGMYIGNYPDLAEAKIVALCNLLNAVE